MSHACGVWCRWRTWTDAPPASPTRTSSSRTPASPQPRRVRRSGFRVYLMVATWKTVVILWAGEWGLWAKTLPDAGGGDREPCSRRVFEESGPHLVTFGLGRGPRNGSLKPLNRWWQPYRQRLPGVVSEWAGTVGSGDPEELWDAFRQRVHGVFATFRWVLGGSRPRKRAVLVTETSKFEARASKSSQKSHPSLLYLTIYTIYIYI